MLGNYLNTATGCREKLSDSGVSSDFLLIIKRTNMQVIVEEWFSLGVTFQGENGLARKLGKE